MIVLVGARMRKIGVGQEHSAANTYHYLKRERESIEGELKWVNILRSKGNVLCEIHVRIEKRSLNVTLLTVTLPLFIICQVYVEASVSSEFLTFHSNLMVFVEVAEVGLGFPLSKVGSVSQVLCVESQMVIQSSLLALRGD